MTTQTVLKLTVELACPWLVGDPDGLGEVDTVPLRDPDGSAQVPATSVAGSLRAHLEGRGTEWMGGAPGDNDNRTASTLRILGVRTDGGERAARRTSTAVNPHTGAAERASLRRVEHIDAPTSLIVHLMHPGEPDTSLLESLATWKPVIGRHRTNGWGQATVTAIRYGRVDLDDREQLVRWLVGGGPALIDALATTPVNPAPATPVTNILTVRCSVVAGLHVGTGEPVDSETGASQEPGRAMLVSDVAARDRAPYVPGSSLRGVFRTHAGFILRSLGMPDDRTDLTVAQLFGSAERRGLLTFHDVAVTEPVHEDRPHVGIDRVTGGAKPGLLFGERSVWGTVDLRVSAERAGEVPGWARSLLWHTVQDIADGFLAVGGHTTRGLGTLAVQEWPPGVALDGIDIEAIAAAAPSGAAREGEPRDV